jgi:HlyD family secretion protein
VAEAEAQVAAQRALLDRLQHGSRPEEIAQARANVEAAQAEARNARRQSHRKQALLGSSAVSREDAEIAQAEMETANAHVDAAQKALDLAIAGPREEDIRQAQAQLRANEAQAELLHQQLKDAELLAPAAGIVRTRLLEPGEMASPERPVVALAQLDPKWVRAYVAEPDLIRLRPGQAARIAIDGAPGRAFAGWVGFISPVAEFTPKTIQTEELRTSLVYEVRVFVHDEADELRLGMPATVTLETGAPASAATPAPAPGAPRTDTPRTDTPRTDAQPAEPRP